MKLSKNIAKGFNSLKAAGTQKAVKMAMAAMQTQVDDLAGKYGLDQRKSNAALAQVKAMLTQVAGGKMTIGKAKQQLRGPVFDAVLAAASTTTKTDEMLAVLQSKMQQGKVGKFTAFLPQSIKDALTGEVTNMQQRLVSELSAKAKASQLVEVEEEDVTDDSLAEPEALEMDEEEEVCEEQTETPDADFERLDNGVVVVTEETTEEQDEAFVDSLMSVKAPTAASPLQTGQAAMEAVSNLVSMSNEVMKFTEVQKTKRTQINAEKEVALARINSTSQLLKDYLQKTHDERSSIFQKQFEVIDHALQSGNVQELALTLNAMNDLAKSSPFKDLANIGQVQNMLQDDSTEFDF